MTDLIERLRKRAEIRRQIPTRKSVQEGQPDRLADLLEEAADRLEILEKRAVDLPWQNSDLRPRFDSYGQFDGYYG